MRWLITGASGQLGSYLLQEIARRGHHDVVAWSRKTTGSSSGISYRPVDITLSSHTEASFAEARPDIVLHAAAEARVANAVRLPELAAKVNTEGTSRLASLASEVGARFLYVSTDMVFSGDRAPYKERDPVKPLSTYGATKAAAEELVLQHPNASVARVSLLHGPTIGPRQSFFNQLVASLRGAGPIKVFSDEWRTPIGLAGAASALIDIAESSHTGRLHVGGPERLTRAELAMRLAAFLNLDASALAPVRRADVPAPEPRPMDLSLDSTEWRRLFPKSSWATLEEAWTQMGPF